MQGLHLEFMINKVQRIKIINTPKRKKNQREVEVKEGSGKLQAFASFISNVLLVQFINFIALFHWFEYLCKKKKKDPQSGYVQLVN